MCVYVGITNFSLPCGAHIYVGMHAIGALPISLVNFSAKTHNNHEFGFEYCSLYSKEANCMEFYIWYALVSMKFDGFYQPARLT